MTNWRDDCEVLQAQLDEVIKERDEWNEWKEKFIRLALWMEQPRLPARGRSTLDCVGTDNGKASTQTYTTMGYREGDDLK